MSGTATLEGDFSLAWELTGNQRRESLQNQSGNRKADGPEKRSGKIVLVNAQKSEDGTGEKQNTPIISVITDVLTSRTERPSLAGWNTKAIITVRYYEKIKNCNFATEMR